MKKRTQALAITPEVKRAVARRDSIGDWPCCVWCGRPAPTENPTAYSCAHFISRAQGGLGIEENILTLCPDCHRLYDATEKRMLLRAYFAYYLRVQYGDWNEEKLTYTKEEEA